MKEGNKEKKKVRALGWRKWLGKRGKKEIKKKRKEKSKGMCVEEKKRGEKRRKIWIKK